MGSTDENNARQFWLPRGAYSVNFTLQSPHISDP